MSDGRGSDGLWNAEEEEMEWKQQRDGWEGVGKGGEEERSGTSERNDEGKGRRSCRDGKGGGF